MLVTEGCYLKLCFKNGVTYNSMEHRKCKANCIRNDVENDNLSLWKFKIANQTFNQIPSLLLFSKPCIIHRGLKCDENCQL